MWDIPQTTALCTKSSKKVVKMLHNEIITGQGWVSVSSYVQRWRRMGKAHVNKYQLQDSKRYCLYRTFLQTLGKHPDSGEYHRLLQLEEGICVSCH